MNRLIWPGLIFLGMLSVLLIDAGRGLDSPGFWLIPLGLVGGLVSIYSKPKNRPSARGSNYTVLDTSLIIVWLAAFFCIGGLRFGWLTTGFGVFIYFWPTILLTLIGSILLIVRITKERKR